MKEKQTSTDEKKGYSEDRVLTANKAKVPFPSLLQALSILLIFLASKLTLQGVFQLIWEDRILENDPLVFFTRVLVYVTPFLITFLLGNLFRRGMPANGSLINPSYEFSWLWLILALGPLMFFSLQLNRLLFLFIPPDPHWLKSIDDWLNMDPIWLQLILYAVLPAIFEEFLFRGMLYPGFERRFGFWIAASLSAGLFAVVHLNPWQLIIAFVLGLYFAFLVKVTKSLLLPMIIHFLNNSIVLILQNLSLQALPSPEMETPGRLDTIGNTDWMLFIEISGSVFVAITLFSVCLGLYFRDSKTQ